MCGGGGASGTARMRQKTTKGGHAERQTQSQTDRARESKRITQTQDRQTWTIIT